MTINLRVEKGQRVAVDPDDPTQDLLPGYRDVREDEINATERQADLIAYASTLPDSVNASTGVADPGLAGLSGEDYSRAWEAATSATGAAFDYTIETVSPANMWRTVGGSILQDIPDSFVAFGDDLSRTFITGILGPEAAKDIMDVAHNGLHAPRDGETYGTATGPLIVPPRGGFPDLTPEIQQPSTGAGRFTREGLNFLVPFMLGVGPVKRAYMARHGMSEWAAELAAAATTGGIVDSVVFDPIDQHMREQMDGNTELREGIEGLIYGKDPEDPELLQRLRGAVVGMGFGVLADSALFGIRWYVKQRRARIGTSDDTPASGDLDPDAPAPRTAAGGQGLPAFTGATRLMLPDPETGSVAPRVENVGTGQGSGDFGWGNYSASSAESAKGYAGEYMGDVYFSNWSRENPELAAKLQSQLPEMPPGHAMDSSVHGIRPDGMSEDVHESILGWWEATTVGSIETPPGYVYEKLLYGLRHNVDREDLLDWDKPVAEQSEKVADVLRAEFGDLVQDHGQSGGALYKALAERLGSEEAASRSLLEAGIPGNVFRSRGDIVTEGGDMYVMFGDALTEVDPVRTSSSFLPPTDAPAPRTAEGADPALPRASEGVPVDAPAPAPRARTDAALLEENVRISPEVDRGVLVAARALVRSEEEVAQRVGDPATPARLDAAAEAAPEVDELPFTINFDRIETTEDVDKLLVDINRIFSEEVDVARRGKRSNEATVEAALDGDTSIDEILQGVPGQAYNAEQITRIRMIHTAAAEKLEALARAASQNAGPNEQYRFAKMLATFQAINKVFMGARAEAGRTLQSLGIRQGTPEQMAVQMDAWMRMNVGGGGHVADWAESIAKFREAGGDMAGLMNHVGALRKSPTRRTGDALRELFINNLVSSWQTHIVNSASPFITAAVQLAETGAHAGIATARRKGYLVGEADEGAPTFNEVYADFHGMRMAIREVFHQMSTAYGAEKAAGGGLRARGRAALQGLDDLRSDMKIPVTSKVQDAGGAISARALGGPLVRVDKITGLEEVTGMGRVVDFIGKSLRLPSEALGVEDNFGKIIGAFRTRHAQAMRLAQQEAGGDPERAKEIYRHYIANPTDKMKLAEVENALYTTYTDKPGKFVTWINEGRNMSAFPSWLVIPFVNTPAKLVGFTVERVPGLNLLHASHRRALAAGGAERDAVLAKLAMGAATMSYFMSLAEEGRITGSLNPGERGIYEAYQRLGIQADSVIFAGPDGPVSVRMNRLDMYGSQLSIAANIVQVLRTREWDEEDLEGIMPDIAAAAISMGETATSKTFLTGLRDIVTGYRTTQSEGLGVALTDYAEKQAGNFVPYSAAMRQIGNMTTEGFPDPTGVVEQIQSRIAYWRDSLPLKRDLWGRVIKMDQAYGEWYDGIAPMRAVLVKNNPIDLEILNLSRSRHTTEPFRGLRQISKNTQWGEVALDEGMYSGPGVRVSFSEFPRVYEEYVRLSGNELKWADDQGTMDYLNRMVKSRDYIRLSDEAGGDDAKVRIIRDVVSHGRLAARLHILDPENYIGSEHEEEFAAFRDHVASRTRASIERVMSQGEEQ